MLYVIMLAAVIVCLFEGGYYSPCVCYFLFLCMGNVCVLYVQDAIVSRSQAWLATLVRYSMYFCGVSQKLVQI